MIPEQNSREKCSEPLLTRTLTTVEAVTEVRLVLPDAVTLVTRFERRMSGRDGVSTTLITLSRQVYRCRESGVTSNKFLNTIHSVLKRDGQRRSQSRTLKVVRLPDESE
jgi:hypothetical protein